MKIMPVLICCVSLISCQDKVICPAFQSTYILDDSTRNAYFSYLWQLDEGTRVRFLAQQGLGEQSDDTLGVVAQPKTDYFAYVSEKIVPWRLQKRTNYGIIKKVPYQIKKHHLRTAPMENILAPEPISNNFIAADFSDSLVLDSLSIAMDSTTVGGVQTEAEEEIAFLYGYDPSDNFNVEQLYYNKHFAERLVNNRSNSGVAQADSLADAQLPDSLQFKGSFFKGLFKKKKKEPVLPVEEEAEEIE